MVAITNNKMAPFPGGVSIFDSITGEVIGSVGTHLVCGREECCLLFPLCFAFWLLLC
jgi:hypothetical protein